MPSLFQSKANKHKKGASSNASASQSHLAEEPISEPIPPATLTSSTPKIYPNQPAYDEPILDMPAAPNAAVSAKQPIVNPPPPRPPPPIQTQSQTMQQVDDSAAELRQPNKQMHDLTRYLGSDNATLGIGSLEIKPSKAINVLMVGRSQSGKSTIIDTLKNPHNAVSSSGFSQTRDPECHRTTIIDQDSGLLYQLTILDTPGLQEVRREYHETRKNHELLRLASACVEEQITTLNVVCFVGPIRGLQQNDIAAFQEIREFLGEEFSKVSLLVLTQCDRFGEDRLDELEKDIREHPVSSPIYKFCELGTCRVGAVDMDEVNAFNDKLRAEVICDKLRKIEKSRRELANVFIKAADDFVRIGLMQNLQQRNKDALPELLAANQHK